MKRSLMILLYRAVFLSLKTPENALSNHAPLSKTAEPVLLVPAGGYTVVPHALVRKTESGKELELNKWLRRQTTKFNGVLLHHPTRCRKLCSVSRGKRNAATMLAFYKENAGIMARRTAQKGIKFYGGTIHPMRWLQCPQGMSSGNL